MDAWGHATEVDEGNGVTVVRGYSQVTGVLSACPRHLVLPFRACF